jgi:thiamine-monophosphate kinase
VRARTGGTGGPGAGPRSAQRGAPTALARRAAAGRGGELGALERLAAVLPRPPRGETWIGDDAAVLPVAAGTSDILFATDLVVAGVHFDLSLTTCSDAGWKALASNVSDIAAMGGRPWRCVAAVSGATGEQLAAITDGISEAAARWRCPLVGGDLSAGEGLVICVAILGLSTVTPVLRSGARPGDLLFVTGALGQAAAGLRMLRADHAATGELVAAHRRPQARVEEGVAAARCGATAMIDVSDGLALDVHRLALASGVGIELGSVPVAAGATLEDALGGGEDYELVIAAPDGDRLARGFAEAGLRAPVEVGRCVEDVSRRSLRGARLDVTGWEHELG